MRIALALFLLAWLACAGAQEKYPITIEAPRDEGGATLWARNDGPAPVSIVLRLTAAQNVQTDVPLPIVAVVPPRNRLRLMGISPKVRTQGWRYGYSWTWRLGSYTARHDPNAAYRVPWMDGRTFRIDQAPGGRITTHTTPSSREAIDITMPEGTPIVAARAGVVIRVSQGFSEGGTDESMRTKANVVQVLHDDGTIADYVHFMNQGVVVRFGEAVEAGTLLGHAGSTGYSSGPHLHFAIVRVAREGDALDYVSVPFSFYVGRPAHVFAPISGMMVPAEYGSPGVAPGFARGH
jgi:murein DD-endopeptidase MepM/ murein hydrolase activator NlpD